MNQKTHRGNFTVNVNFNLRKTTPSNEPTAINAVVRFNNERVVISGIDKVEPRFWNSDKQSPKQHAANDRAKSISTNISDAKSIITKIFEHHTKSLNEYPSDLKEFQKQCRRQIFNLPDEEEKAIIKKSTNFLEYLKRLRDDIKEGKRVIAIGKRKGQPYAKNSHKPYGNLIRNIKAFMEFHKISELHFNDIDLDFYTEFRAFTVVKESKTPSYFGTLIKCLKTTMSDAAEFGLHSSQKHKSRNFIKETHEADTIFLDQKKLDILSGLDLSNNPTLDRTRDITIAGACIGQRFSDFSSIKPKDIDGDYISLKSQKEGQRVTIPIMDNLRAVLDKYDGQMPPIISNQNLNDNLKELGKKAGFTELVDVTKFKNGKRVIVSVPFWQLMSTHTLRRSFATNMFKKGIPTILIMAITGHTTEKAFLTYIRMNNEDKAKMMMEMLRRHDLKVVNGGVE